MRNTLNVCCLTIVTTNYPKWFTKSMIKFSTNLASICETLFLSTYHTWIYFLPFTICLDTYISYVFSSKHFSTNVSEYNLYRCRDDSMHPFMAHTTNIYETFCPFAYLMFFLCSWLIWHIISTKITLNSNESFIIPHICIQVRSRKINSGYFYPFT